VVKPHGESSATLLAIRQNDSLEEMSYEGINFVGKRMRLPVVTSFDLNTGNPDDLIKSLEKLPWFEEGYVVVDAKFNRVKIKNPAYVAVHHLKSKLAEHHIITIVKTNELDEFIATFPERADELRTLKVNYDLLVEKLDSVWKILEPFKPNDNEDRLGKKTYAEKVFVSCKENDISKFSGLYFGLGLGKYDSVKSYLLEYDDRELYKIL
jgi:hypothetical protein